MNNKVLEELKKEYNETLNRAQDIGEIIANCVDIDTSHCGLDSVRNEEELQSLEELLGMEVVAICGSKTKCEGCARGNTDCVKLELVGGDYLCLAKPQQEESITEIDDSPKSFEETYRDSMNLLREFCIKQSEANRRLVNALKEESEALKKPVISFDEEEGNVMDDIREKAEAFMDYLDSIVSNGKD